MRKIFYIGVLSTLLLAACAEAEHPIPKDEFIEFPKYEGEYVEFPVYSNDEKGDD